MKNIRKRLVCVALTLALVLGLAAPALAAATFADVPETHWAYTDVEAAAAAGVMNGTGGGLFSPDMKVSVSQFLTLVGRVVFPDVKTEGTDWYGPFISAAQEKGLLTGTQVNVSLPEAEISRYDMAVILRAAAKLLGMTEKAAQPSEVTDYGLVPTMYADAVLAVYGMGLIRGDQSGNFNGTNTMTRAEVATVVMRLVRAKGGSSQGGSTTDPVEPTTPPTPTDPDEPDAPKDPDQSSSEPQMVTARAWGSLRYYPTQGKGTWNDPTVVTEAGIPFKLLYTEDGGETSTLILESQTKEPYSKYDLEFPLDKRLLDNPNGQFYISTQYEKDGQLFVTQDLRTDGRKAISPVIVYEKGKGSDNTWLDLVPPTGQRWDFTLTGTVPSSARSEQYKFDDISPSGFTVQLVYYPNPNRQNGVLTGERVVLAETTASEDGRFEMPVSVDTLDRISGEHYRIEVQGVYNGKSYYSSKRGGLWTLSEILKRTNAAGDIILYFDL